MGIIWYELKRRIAILHKELMYHLVVVICSHRMDVSGRHTGFMKAVARQLQAGRTSLREMTRTSIVTLELAIIAECTLPITPLAVPSFRNYVCSSGCVSYDKKHL